MNTPDMDRLAAEADDWRRAGDLARACEAFDTILEQDGKHPGALRGRARIALACGDDKAPDWFERGLKVDPGSADLWLGKAQALDVTGDSKGALRIARQLAEQAPNWLEGLRFLGQLRLAGGEEDFASHYGAAARKVPRDPNIWFDWANQLAATDRFEDAAEVAANAALRFPEQPEFQLQHAMHASAAGDLARADVLFAKLAINSSERMRTEARHRIRCGQFAAAEDLLNTVLVANTDDIAASALMGLVWRATGNAKARWLHEQDGIYGRFPLLDDGNALAATIPLLHRLHDNAALPIGQSLRGGTQTRGNLFDRLEPEFAALKRAIEATLEEYRATLPPQDLRHPLLRHRRQPWQIAGSWSVRLSGGSDHHKSHIHPSGVISSALYLEVPEKDAGEDPEPGWLELGRPPADLKLDLEPLALIKPKPGHLALFPSTLYHGTRRFNKGQRLTVTFDVISGA
uniref:2OG-Fe(II) oxygenase family protein n=1 Tax=uncultured Altererythrobacter sp. TaxID=500840 RepID=UPI002630CC1C|nr:putative 2OG-Fe(II) oxygenase [uncultured Altererythrobacter sp.]